MGEILLLNATGPRPALIAGTGEERRRLPLLDRPLAAPQHYREVGHRRGVAAEHAALLHRRAVVAPGRKLQLAGALERHHRAPGIGVVLGQQDAELIARPAGPLLAVAVLLEVEVLARGACVGGARP